MSEFITCIRNMYDKISVKAGRTEIRVEYMKLFYYTWIGIVLLEDRLVHL